MVKKWVKNYVGIPFEWNGHSHSGVDCYGLIRLIFRERFLIEIPEFCHSKDPENLSRCFRDGIKSDMWKLDCRRENNVIVLNVKGHPLHCGLMLNKTEMIHAAQGGNVCVERVDGVFWKDRHAGYYRHKDLPL